MENNIPVHLQEVIFASSDTAISRQLGKLEKKGQIKKLHHASIRQISMKRKK
jgi:hypothetical protein